MNVKNVQRETVLAARVSKPAVSRISNPPALLLFSSAPAPSGGVISVEPRTTLCSSSVRSGLFFPMRDPHGQAIGGEYAAPTGLGMGWRMISTTRSLLTELLGPVSSVLSGKSVVEFLWLRGGRATPLRLNSPVLIRPSQTSIRPPSGFNPTSIRVESGLNPALIKPYPT